MNGNRNAALDALQQRYAGGFDRAVTTSFGAGRSYPELERQLRLNASRFGTYKAYDLTQRLDALKRSGLSKEELDRRSKILMQSANGTQKTEYNTLVARSRTAKQFERFKEERDLYPNIEWLHTRSATPRELHLTYVGTILPQDDPFWQNNQPGNEWGCKCDWRTTDKPTNATPTSVVPPAPGLEGNPADTGELVTGNHPYYTRNSKAPWWLDDKAILQAPDEVVFTRKQTNNANSYLEHLLISNAEKAENRFFAGILADNGYKKVELLPQIEHVERRLRKRYYGDIQDYAKCPDARIGGTMIEFKKLEEFHLRNFNDAMLDADKKAKMAIVWVKTPANTETLKEAAEHQFTLRKHLDRIYFYNNGELVKFRRKKAK